MVPHLVTALTGPINELEQRILESMPAIERWFRLEWMEHTPAFYSSVNLRNAGYKLSPLSTELFPDSFNHLSAEMMPLAVQAAMAAIEKICPEARNLLLLPRLENHSPAYLTHLQRLVQVFSMAGLNVRLGSLDANQSSALALALPDGGTLSLEPLKRSPRRLGLKDFDPCTILLNSSLAGGVPASLRGLNEQYLLPPLHAGWGTRRQHQHFQSYEEVAKKFAKLLGMDPWLLNPLFARCELDDWRTPAGMESLQSQVEALLTRIRRKHKEYGINEKPFVVLKSNHGAEELRPITLRDAKDVEALQGLAQDEAPHDLLLQEGLPSCEQLRDAAAEPVVCMIDRYVVGGYYRLQTGHGAKQANPGFMPLAFAENLQLPKPGARPGASQPNRFYMYGVIGRLAMLAAAYEMEATDPNAEVYD